MQQMTRQPVATFRTVWHPDRFHTIPGVEDTVVPIAAVGTIYAAVRTTPSAKLVVCSAWAVLPGMYERDTAKGIMRSPEVVNVAVARIVGVKGCLFVYRMMEGDSRVLFL